MLRQWVSASVRWRSAATRSWSPVIANLERVLQVLQEALQEVAPSGPPAIAEHQQHLQLQDDAQRLLALPGIGPKVVLPLLVLLRRWPTLTAGEGLTNEK